VGASLSPLTHRRFNIRLVLALGNLWPAYFGPERWLSYAHATHQTHADIYDFYSDAKARALYKQHISAIVNRVNTFTGVAYRGGWWRSHQHSSLC
jgi:mannan endo-1,4-beta-mannosidase